jgi:hypothetical protein
MFNTLTSIHYLNINTSIAKFLDQDANNKALQTAGDIGMCISDSKWGLDCNWIY